MMSLRGRLRVRSKTAVAGLLVGSLLGWLFGGVPPVAASPAQPPSPNPGPAASGVHPVPSHFTKAADQAASPFHPSATRFPAGSATQIDLSTAAGTARHPASTTATPVWAQLVADEHGHYTGPSRVTVTVLDHAQALAAGVDGVLLTVAPAGTGTGPVRVGLDYGDFAEAYGGNYGSRLRLAVLPACALTTPAVPACRQARPLPSTNDPAHRTVSAPLALTAPGTFTTAAQPGALVLAASTDPGQEGGSAGSYAATTLKPEGSWMAGGSSGGFTYSYPVTVPPAVSSLVPQSSLSYDSSGVDGQTASTQTQSSWVGDGWSTPRSFVEQSFVPCSDSPEGSPSPVSTSDECYAGPVLTLALNGSTSSLVWDSGRSVWKPQGDNGEIVTHVVNSGNGTGTYNTDYWTVTDRSGTTYQFGRNELPGWGSGKPSTNSVDSEPVYSAHSGDPCYSSAGFTSSVCTMAYRWNLDYVTDVHGDAMAYYYKQDTNYYGEDKGATMVSYVRDSHLDHVDYGFTDGNAYGTAPDRVAFATGDRCVSGTCDPLNATNAANWPDVPFDLVCNQGATCQAQGPSFFSTVRLTSISAMQYSVASSSYVTVDSYALSESFPATGDGTSPTLWLDSVTHTGSGTGGGGSTIPVTLPPTVFGKVQLQNRVDTVTDGLPPFYRYRLASVTTEAGSVISPTYSLVDPCTAPVTVTPSANTSSCYPVSWTPPGYTASFTDWFNKYVVTKVTATDPTGGAPATATSYVYKDQGAAWHFDDNEVVQAKYRTYGQFRGYSDVIALTGDGANDRQTRTESLYFQGMSKDNNTTVVSLTDSAGGVHEDLDQLAGKTLETTTYVGNGGPVDHSTITSYWVSAATASRTRSGLPTLTATWTEPAETYARQAVTAGGTTTWRYTETDVSYDATVTDATVGLPTHTYTHTVPAAATYDRCTTTTYTAPNTSANVVGLIAEIETDSVACGGLTEGTPPSVPAALNTLTAPATVIRPDQVVADGRTYYDDPTFSTTFPQPNPPSRGDVTLMRKAVTWAGGAFTYQTTAHSTYDSYGRLLTAYDGNGNKTTNAYTMNGVGLTTAVAVTNPLNQTSSTTLDPQRALQLTVTDANGVVSTRQYDALGRVTGTWLYSRPTTAPANYTYAYQVSNTAITAVTTKQLNDQAGYLTKTTIYDGQLRERQVQASTPQSGRMVSDTFYDSRGWVHAKYTRWWDSATLPDTTLVAAGSNIPQQDFYTYDGMGRAVVDTSEANGVVKSTTTTVYNGDRATVIPPTGGVPQTTITDPLGRTVEVDQYSSAPTLNTPADTFTGIWSVSGGTTSVSTYGYDGHGDQSAVIDPGHHTWTSTYNVLGQVTARTDADDGTSTIVYDADGNAVQSTDSRGRTVSTTYDALNRKTALYDAPTSGQTSANELASWVYDNANNVAGVTNPIGHLTTAMAYWGGAAYVKQYTGFNNFGRSLGEKVTIPSTTEGTVLGTTYTFSHVYTSTNGLLLKDVYPAAGGLPAETVLHTYTAQDLPNAVGTGYGYKTTYDAWGRADQEAIGSSTSLAYVTDSYDAHTGLLADQLVTRQVATPSNVDDEAYTYDPAGNLTRQVSTRLGASTPTETRCYAYDGLDRLSSAWTATDDCSAVPTQTNHATVGDSLGLTSAYWTTWGFDPSGDRTSEVDHSTTGGTDTTIGYTYDGNAAGQPHTLTSTSSTGGTTASTSYRYDSAGHMTTRNAAQGNQTLTWDDAGRLVGVSGSTGGTSTLRYDSEGSLLVEKDPTTTTLYLPDEQIVLNNSTGTTTGTRYYKLPGGVTVVRTGTATTAYQFEVTDQHNTPVLYLDSTAQNPTWRQSTPYGAPRGTGAPWPDDHGFLNSPADAVTGLTQLGARCYDPFTGRFISNDPLFNANQPQSWNGYSYSANNPVTNADPSGKDWTPDPGNLQPPDGGWCPDPGGCGDPNPTPSSGAQSPGSGGHTKGCETSNCDHVTPAKVYGYVGAGLYVDVNDPRFAIFQKYYEDNWGAWADHTTFGAANFWSWYCNSQGNYCGKAMTDEYNTLALTEWSDSAKPDDAAPGGGVVVSGDDANPDRDMAEDLATIERDDFISYLIDNTSSKTQLGRVNVVVGAYSPQNGKTYVGWSLIDGCAETDCRNQAIADGVDPSTLVYSNPMRPKDLEVIPVCKTCQANIAKSQMPSDVDWEGKPDPWNGGVSPQAQAALMEEEMEEETALEMDAMEE